MTLISEKIAVTAKNFIHPENINEAQEFRDPFMQTKMKEFGWSLDYGAASVACEVIWAIGLKGIGLQYSRAIHRMFSPSPLATHANFRGSEQPGLFKTGNVPEVGAIAFWKKGNSWIGHMAVVVAVSEDNLSFDVVEGKVMSGSSGIKFLGASYKKGKQVGLPFKQDAFNLIGFVYPPNVEIP